MSEVIAEATVDVPVAQVKWMSLRRNFFWTLLGNVVLAACQWGMLVSLAKIGTPEIVGQFALGLAVTAPIFMLTNLNLRSVQATDAKSDYGFADYLGLRIWATLLALGLTLLVVAVTGYKQQTVLVILALAVFKGVEALSDTLYGLFQKHEAMATVAKSMMLNGVLAVMALSATYYATGDLFLAVIVTAAVKALILLGYDRRNGLRLLHATTPGARRLRQLPVNLRDRQTLFSLTLLALPLGVVTMLNSLNTNIPRYLLERSLGERELGIFAAMAYLMVAGTTVVSALGFSASPRLAKHFAAQDLAGFRRLLVRLLQLGLAGGALGIVIVRCCGDTLLTLLYGPDYAGYGDVFLLIMVASALSYLSSFLGVALTAARCFKIQMPINLLSLTVIFAACWGLIPRFGLKGAALGIICMFAAQIPLKAYVLHGVLHQSRHLHG